VLCGNCPAHETRNHLAQEAFELTLTREDNPLCVRKGKFVVTTDSITHGCWSGSRRSDYRVFNGAGLPNFASSIETFVLMSFSTIESRPSSHAYVMWNGNLTPLTSR
jgi:hypothetical protein